MYTYYSKHGYNFWKEKLTKSFGKYVCKLVVKLYGLEREEISL